MDAWPSNLSSRPECQDSSACNTSCIVDLSSKQRETEEQLGSAEALDGPTAPGYTSIALWRKAHVHDCHGKTGLLLVQTADGAGLWSGQSDVPAQARHVGGTTKEEACTTHLAPGINGELLAASQAGRQNMGHQNGTAHPQKWNSGVMGSWEESCSGKAVGSIALQGHDAVNGGLSYAPDDSVCTTASSLVLVNKMSTVLYSSGMESSLSSDANVTTLGPTREEPVAASVGAEGTAAGAGRVKCRNDCHDEGVAMAMPCRASPVRGRGVPEGNVRKHQQNAAANRHFKTKQRPSCSPRRSETLGENMEPSSGKMSSSAQSVNTQTTEPLVSSDTGVGEVGVVQISPDTCSVSEEMETVLTADIWKCQRCSSDCSCTRVFASPHAHSPLAPCGLVVAGVGATESMLQDTSPPSAGAGKGPTSSGTSESFGRVFRKDVLDRKAAVQMSGSAPRRRPKKSKVGGQASVFGPPEPDIVLRYASHREERRGARVESFAPYIRLDQGEFAVCAVVNSPEDECVKMGRQAPGKLLLGSSTVPSSSCLTLGRHRQRVGVKPGPVCCLCHKASHAPPMGDLHGPYHSIRAGPHPEVFTSACVLDEEEGESSNRSDSSRSTHGRRTDHSPDDTRWSLRRGALSEANHSKLGNSDRVRSNAREESSPPSKLACLSACSLGDTEYWVHEDCSVWSPGIFLVRGKLYGLEEAIRLGQKMVCSLCHEDGATLWCFFKGCPSKYHYSCAAQAGCVLNEENFSMKCPLHKNTELKHLVHLEDR